MHIANVCYLMRWTYQEYDSQPEWLLEGLSIKMREDNKFANRKQPKLKGKR